MIADDLRRQADVFIELADLRSKSAAIPPSGRRRAAALRNDMSGDRRRVSPARPVSERISMAVVVAGLTVVWSGIALAAIRHLIVL